MHLNHFLVNCSKNKDLCKSQRLDAFPEIRVYLPKGETSLNPGFIDYEYNDRRAGTIGLWLSRFLGPVRSFESNIDWIELNNRECDWLVHFKTIRHPKSVRFSPVFAAASNDFPDIQFAEVDCNRWAEKCSKEYFVSEFPTVMRFSVNRSDPPSKIITDFDREKFSELFRKLISVHDEL